MQRALHATYTPGKPGKHPAKLAGQCAVYGSSCAALARQVERRERHVRTWARRFATQGMVGLSDKKRPGRRPVCGVRGTGWG